MDWETLGGHWLAPFGFGSVSGSGYVVQLNSSLLQLVGNIVNENLPETPFTEAFQVLWK